MMAIIIMGSMVIVMVVAGITAKAEKTALIGPIAGRDITDLPGIRIAIAGIVTGTVSMYRLVSFIGSARTQEQAGGGNKQEIGSLHREV